MATHRVYGFTRVAGAAVARRVDVIDVAVWATDGLEAAVLGGVVSSAIDGSWEVDLDGDSLVYVVSPPVPPYGPLLLGPLRPEPL